MVNALKLAAIVRLLLGIAIFSLSYWSISSADDDKSLNFESALPIVEETEGSKTAYFLNELYREGHGFEWN